MTNDIEILQQIHEELKRVNYPPFDPVVISFYGRLMERVPEDGFEQYLPDKWVTEKEEEALLELTRYEYLDSGSNHTPGDGMTWYVNLRSKRFHEIAGSVTSATTRQKKSEALNMTMKDSGKRETFESGAVRDSDECKPHPEYVSPFAMERLSRWLAAGAKKYTPRNWERGLGSERCFASMYRHLLKYQMGEHDEDHLAAIFCNCMMILHYEEMVRRGVLPPSLLDMPKYQAATDNDESNQDEHP